MFLLLASKLLDAIPDVTEFSTNSPARREQFFRRPVQLNRKFSQKSKNFFYNQCTENVRFINYGKENRF